MEKQLITNTKDGPAYTAEVKKFAFTLQFYSTKAYEYVRSVFEKKLPHTGTVRNWLVSVNAEPGILYEALETIKNKVTINKTENKQLVGCIIFDEMAIRKEVVFHNGKFEGYVNYGVEFDHSSELNVASQALTYMLNVTNDRWKIPIAYFLVSSVSSKQKMNFTKMVIEKIESTGIIINAIVFDGHSVNISSSYLLGKKRLIKKIIN